MNEFRCCIFVISDETGNSQFDSVGNSQCGFRSGRIFQVKIDALGIPSHFSQEPLFASERHYPEFSGGHSLIKVTGGGSDIDVFT